MIDPYFSATKLAWLLDEVPGARAAAERGELAFGTIDSFLLWRLTGGKVHATDASNASRTMLYDIHRQDWDDDLLRLLVSRARSCPRSSTAAGCSARRPPSCSARRCRSPAWRATSRRRPSARPASAPGMIKSTYGTGCFALLNTGATPVASSNRLLTTIAWRIDGKTTYALEGSIFVAGAAVQWLRDGLKLIGQARRERAARGRHRDTGGVYLVPAFVGLGAPIWDPHARGTIVGLTRSTGIAEIVRATLEAVGYQTRDLMLAMHADLPDGHNPDANGETALRVDGGMVANSWVCQFLADILDVPVERPVVTETTALGAAYLAGLAVGLYPSLESLADVWRCERRFEPKMAAAERHRLYAGWLDAIRRSRGALASAS